jgi:hypothetical protein
MVDIGVTAVGSSRNERGPGPWFHDRLLTLIGGQGRGPSAKTNQLTTSLQGPFYSLLGLTEE